MKKYKLKKAIKIIVTLWSTLILVIITCDYLILHPEFYIDQSLSYSQFRVYSNNPVEPEIKTLLDDVLKRLKKSEIHTESRVYKIIFTENNIYSKLFKHKEIAFAFGNCIMLNGNVDVKENRIIRPFLEMNLTYAIVHEAVHCDQYEVFSIYNPLNFNKYQKWKKEGYAEFVSQQYVISQNFQGINERINWIEKFESKEPLKRIDLGDGYLKPLYYLKSELLIDYLITVKKMSYLEIMNMTFDEENLLKEVKDFNQTPRNQSL